jgi:hypothetical protein
LALTTALIALERIPRDFRWSPAKVQGATKMPAYASDVLVQDALHHLREQEALFATMDGQQACSPLVKLLSHSLTTYYRIRRLAMQRI